MCLIWGNICIFCPISLAFSFFLPIFAVMKNRYVRFDWAMKRLLRNKANHVVLEGFLSVLMGQDIRIVRFLESEGNQESAVDKYNRVDIMCEDSSGAMIIIEIQNERAYSYFQRMVYGTSKALTEHIELGQDYDHVAKVYSVNIVYFDLGQGTDYVYHGMTVFHGLHDDDELLLSDKQRELFGGTAPGDLMPEYFVLKVNDFNDVAKDSLDEWISFLKTGDIDDSFTAKGLPEARERLRIDLLSESERREYIREQERQMVENDVMRSKYIDGLAEGIETANRENARKMKADQMPIELIAKYTGLTEEEIGRL